MEESSIRLADGLMAASANIADFVSASYGLPRETIDVVHCGVDGEAFRPSTNPEPTDGRPTVLFAGTLTEAKGLRTVFEAVLALRSRYPNIRLQVLGSGGDPLANTLRIEARAAGADANIEFVGFVADRARLPEYYRRAQVFASPARHEPGVANAYIEAMACGCPVVVGRTGGAPEAVADGQTGILVPPDDVEATAVALDRLIGDAALRRRMGWAARRRVEEYFAVDKYMGRVLATFEKAITRSRERLARA
jgi:glycosyltransferase involved in cell wall biosynthesis